jgi:hypothetical protein
LDQQRYFFNEKKVEVEAARRFLVPNTKQDVDNEIQEDNSEKARLGVESVLVEEVDGNHEEKETNAKEVYNEVEEGMDDDVSRKDGLYDTGQDDGNVSHSAVEILLFIAVNAGFAGLVVTWHARKLQRKRSGFHKNR